MIPLCTRTLGSITISSPTLLLSPLFLLHDLTTIILLMVPRTIFLAVISTTYQVTFASSITITRRITTTLPHITGVIRSATPSPTVFTSGTSLTSWRQYRQLTTIILLMVPRTVFLAVISTTYQETFASSITIIHP